MRTRAALAVLSVALLAACATTRVVRQANDVAEAGKAYAMAMQALAAYVLDKQVDDQYNMLAQYRKSDRTDVAFYEERLKRDTDDTVALSTSVAIFRKHSQRLADYFDALNALVDANVKDTAGASAKNAAEGLNALGEALATSVHVTASQIDAVSALGKIAITEIHGAEVKRVLEHDSALIARQIGIQELALRHFKREIERMDDKERFDRYEKELKPAYLQEVDKKPAARAALPAEFKTKWVAYVKEPAVAAQLADADVAARKMQEAWRAILEGKPNMTDVVAESGKLLAVAEQAKALHDNRHKPATP